MADSIFSPVGSEELTGQYATGNLAVNLPHVPLEAGAGPDNPPCPACGEPLFPWVGMPVGTGVAHRCEACGLAVLSHGEKFHFPRRPGEQAGDEGDQAYLFDPGSDTDSLAELQLDLDEDGSYAFDNRASLAGWLTGGAWVGLGTDRRYCFTPDAVSRLVATRDQIVTGTSWRPLRGIMNMWQSGLNMFTFGQNVVTGSLGKTHPVPADHAWKRGLDWFISAVLALPAIIVAVPAELVGILFRRGSAARARVQVL